MQAAQYAAAETDARLTEMASRQGALDAELVQLDGALTAADTAQRALGEAARELGSAGDWATYDTFLGGGVFADLAKHHRLDRAGALMRHADAALRHLAAELADVQVAAVGEVGVPELTRTLDIWFDNIFSDWAVRDRIKEASARVHHLRAAVDALGHELARRRAGVQAAQAELAVGRRSMLSAGAVP
ncbi:hypothetical protein [Nocardioides houyundeii]|uniref:hypothetical protein n=1 Tax=Nocardioides houyundeii TaxID=2045452 RepID=UPI000DF47E37|nr:hypothetical protein [Nocardioides houyundeii]